MTSAERDGARVIDTGSVTPPANLIWTALRGPHRHLAQTAPGVAALDDPTRPWAWTELAASDARELTGPSAWL